VRGIKHPRIASRSNLRERCCSPRGPSLSPSSSSSPVPLLLLRFTIVPHLRGPRAESFFSSCEHCALAFPRIFPERACARARRRPRELAHACAPWNTSEEIDHRSTEGTSEERAFSRKGRPRVERGSARKICAAVVYSRAFTEEQCNYRPVIRYTAEYEDRLVRGDRKEKQKNNCLEAVNLSLRKYAVPAARGGRRVRACVYQRIDARLKNE